MSTMTRISDATDRISLRRRKGRRRLWLRVGIIAAVAALLGAGGWLVFGSPVLAVRDVAISGVKVATPEDVRGLAEVPIGLPLAQVDLDAIAARVSGLPPVRSVRVLRSWPNTISIEVTERTALYAIETPGGYWIADEQGVIFRSDTEPGKLVVASVPSGDPRLIRDLGTVLGALPGDLRGRVRQISAATADSITLKLSGGLTIVWGSAEASELKAQVIVPLLKQKGKEYDVSAPSNPTVR